MTNLFKSFGLHFEKSLININGDYIKVPLEKATFGILTMSAAEFGCLEKDYDIIFTIDRSGSMLDKCSDGKTKLQHISCTLKNMLWYFHDNPQIKVFVTIFVFDSSIKQIANRICINSENINTIIMRIDAIRPRSSTDIGLALNTVRKFIQNIQTDGFIGEINHIFMTDGDATVGERNSEVLNTFVDNSYTNVFVGFGIEHNNIILDEISSGPNSSYYFIDKLENSGLVYGEILHGVLYKILKNCEITIKNGLLYDFKKNEWTEHLFVGNIIGETIKNYHVISDNPDKCVIFGKGVSFYNDSVVDDIHCDIVYEDSLMPFIYRQKTLEILYKGKQYSKNLKRYACDDFDFDFDLKLDFMVEGSPGNNIEPNDFVTKNKLEKEKEEEKEKEVMTNNVEKDVLKNEMKALIEEMKQYMKENGLEEDGFMKNLCDDIYICYRTFDTIYGGMYSGARLTSQGTQRCYTVSDGPDININTVLFNDVIDNDNDNNNNNDNPFCNYSLSQMEDTPYSTPCVLKLMKTVSDGRDYDFDNKVYSIYLSSDEDENDFFRHIK